MKNIIGSPARGDSFFPREREIQKILNSLNNGNNLQIAAPRRIGKTSILFHLMDNKIGNYVYTYIDTEAINTESGFFKKLLKELVKVEEIRQSQRINNLFKTGNKFLKKIKSIKVLGHGIDFHEEDDEADYLNDVENFLSGMQLEDDRQLVILMDEFPQTIQNIVIENNGDVTAAKHFLQTNRELRMNPEINGKVRFIVTGSIGLNHTVAAIDATAFVNDLNSLQVEPLTQKEAMELVHELLQPKKIAIEDNVCKYLLQKIEWLIPFHIQLAVQELLFVDHANNKIVYQEIDASFNRIIEARNNNHFEHYSSRLKQHFKNNDFKFAQKLLCLIAESGTVETGVLYNLSVEYEVQENWKKIVDILIYDGYINNVGDKNIYRYNSPVVRMWWNKNIC